jgi:hypothetical protein
MPGEVEVQVVRGAATYSKSRARWRRSSLWRATGSPPASAGSGTSHEVRDRAEAGRCLAERLGYLKDARPVVFACKVTTSA